MPDVVSNAPNENTHAANANTLLSGFGPIAAGTRQSPINIPKAPTAIIQFPVREDMYISLARRELARTQVTNPDHNGFLCLTPDDESHLSLFCCPFSDEVTAVTCSSFL